LALLLLATPAHADRLTLWHIVHDKCVADMQASGSPKPCEAVDLSKGEAQGVAILKDIVGVAQHLAIPTRQISGIESPDLLKDDAPDVWGAAWAARGLVSARLGGLLMPRETISIAVNSSLNRSQDQLHLHIDCVAPDVAAALTFAKDSLSEKWQALPQPLAGAKYWARLLDAEDLAGTAPFRLLADGLDEAKGQMGFETLVAVGAVFEGDKPGFILLASKGDLGGGGHGEDLQDHGCAIMGR
jgi:CDP-diacylglycerol pyrophosphatase